MKNTDIFIYALRSMRPGFAAVYILALLLATACFCFAGAIWADVWTEKQEPCVLSVTAPGYVELNEQTIQDMLEIPEVVEASGRLELSVKVTSGSYTADLNLTGIDGAYLDAVYTQGGLFPEQSAMPWLVLSEAAARSFTDPDKAAQKKKDELPSIDWLSADFTIQTGEITVAAKVCGLTDGEEPTGYISRDMAKTLLQRQGQPAAYTSAAVRITNIGAAEAVTQQIAALGFQVENMDSARQVKWDLQLREAAYLLLLGASVFVCAMLIRTAEGLRNRDRECAQTQALRWMGMPAAKIRALGLAGDICLDILATALGVVVSYIVAWAIPPEMREGTNFALSMPWSGAAMVFALSAGASSFVSWRQR